MKKLLLLLSLIVVTTWGSPKVEVTYFMTTYRCYSCHYLENMTRTTLITNFKKEMKDSTITFRMVNISEPENEHFIEDYKLENKSVVLTKFYGDSIVSWDRVDTLWNFIDMDNDFTTILTKRIENLLN